MLLLLLSNDYYEIYDVSNILSLLNLSYFGIIGFEVLFNWFFEAEIEGGFLPDKIGDCSGDLIYKNDLDFYYDNY